ncbi:MAG TPA: site-2 protease family protein [Nevskia sp.]|nr:site-2 protease family protein [Nevskia sp.]
MNATLITLAVWLLPVLLALTLHEVAHGYAALALGDGTARALGRLSLNPLRHVSPAGTLVLPLLLILTGTGLVLGWGRPLPINSRLLRRPRRDLALVHAAGPAANLAMSLAWYALSRMDVAPGLQAMGHAGVIVNASMAVINLLPFAPFDGAHIARWLLGRPAAELVR